MKKLIFILFLCLTLFINSCAFFTGKLFKTESIEKDQLIETDVSKAELLANAIVTNNVLKIKLSSNGSIILRKERVIFNKKQVNWPLFISATAIDVLTIFPISFALKNADRDTFNVISYSYSLSYILSLAFGLNSLSSEIVNILDISEYDVEEKTLKNAKVSLRIKDKIYNSISDNDGIVTFSNIEVSAEIVNNSELTIYTADDKEIKLKLNITNNKTN